MNVLDCVIVVCVIIGLIKGLRDGFVKQAVSLFALILAIVFAGQISIPVRSFLLQHITGAAVSSQIITALCYIIAFVLIIVAISLIGKMVDVAIKLTPAKPLNIMLGGLFGVFIWTLSLSILLNLFSIFDSSSTILPKQVQEKSKLYNPVKSILPTVYPVWKRLF
ncbi:MAG: CvpA family protein [Dysgonamonadaceae bacterium]|jgi:membrane protein required for colicin V production|nr:CvpA family protein [Dysgonamonadaceae bacterium]